MKNDITTSPAWLRATQDRFVGWELFKRAVDGKVDQPMSDKEFRQVLRRCGITEEEHRAMISETRKRMRSDCPEGLRMMSDTNDYPERL